MMKWRKVVLWLLAIVGAGIISIAVLFEFAFRGMCGNEVWDEHPSPNGALKAVVFQRDCGATTGFSTQVSILDSRHELPNKSGNILILDGHPEQLAPPIEWVENDQLLIHWRLSGSEHLAETSWGTSDLVSVSYECKKIAPHWEVSKPLTIEEAERVSLKRMRELRPDWPQVPFGRSSEEWKRFKGQFTDGDVLVHASMDAPPGLPHGYSGYVRLRFGCPQDFFLLTS